MRAGSKSADSLAKWASAAQRAPALTTVIRNGLASIWPAQLTSRIRELSWHRHAGDLFSTRALDPAGRAADRPRSAQQRKWL